MKSYIYKIYGIEKYKTLVDTLSTTNHAVLLESQDQTLLDAISKLIILKDECKEQNSPCFMCGTCQKVLDGNAVDVEIYGTDKSIVVEDSASIVESQNILPLEFKNKYFILNSIDTATIQSQNKLLKVIEEPRKFVKFILLTKNLDAVLPTIRSRCEVYTLPRFSNYELSNIFDFGTEKQKFDYALSYADGNLSTLECVFNSQTFSDVFSLALKTINLINSGYVLETSYQILKIKADISMYLEILSIMYLDILSIKCGKEELTRNINQLEPLKIAGQSLSEKACIEIVKEIFKAKNDLDSNANFSGVVENLLLKILEIKHNYANSKN